MPDNAIGKQQKGDPAMACVVFGLRKCRSRMATVNGSVLVPYLLDTIGVTLAKATALVCAFSSIPANTLIGGAMLQEPARQTLLDLCR